MNAHIVNQEAGTRKTASTDTAPPADSATPQRIDAYIKRLFGKVESADFSGIRSTANRAEALGFKRAANSRYAEFLEDMRGTPELVAHYAERYPASLFLPWKAFHHVIRALDLWCELPEFYTGSIPEEQLPWMEIFELDPDDRIEPGDLDGMIPGTAERYSQIIQYAIRRQFNAVQFCPSAPWDGWSFQEAQRAIILSGRYSRPIRDLWGPARESFFVVAPPEAFSTTEDFLSRMRRLVTDIAEMDKVAPNDPLIVRMCRGGVLVVAAWGEEGAWLNDAIKEVERG